MVKRLHPHFSKNKLFTGFLYGLLLSLLAASGLQAQVTIPSGNTAANPSDVTITRKPLGNFFGFERSAAIYLSSEIGQTGNITAIGFFVESVNNPAASTPIEIYLKQTTASVFAANTTVTDEQTGATLVYSGNVTSAQLVPNSWITFTLQTPFNYTANNLEVLVKTNGGGSGIEAADAKQFRFNFTGTNVYRFQYWQADGNPPETQGFGGTLSDSRPNIQLTFGSTPQTCAAPTSVSGSGTGQTTATVNFSGGDAGTSYTIEYGPSSTFPSGTTTTTASSSPANLTGLTAGTAYTFVVRTLCANGVTSANSPQGTFTTTAAPQTCAAPTSVSGSGTGQTTATVNFSGGDAGTSYTIEYGPSSTFPSGTTTTTASSSPANLTGLTAGTAYTFVVRTLCANGVTSANSPQGTFTTTAAPQTCAAPTSVSGSGTGQTTATVNFSGGDAGTSYTIEYGPSSTFPSGTTTTTATSSPANLTGLTAGTAYTFVVRTLCANGVTSANSPTGTFTTTAAPQTCAAPTSVSGSGTGQTTATVNFSGGDAGTSYTIEYGPSSTFPSGTTTTTATSSPANLTGLTAGTAYTFVVRTLCANGVTSANSPQGTFTTTAAPQTCDAPTNLTATNITSTSADLNFTASTTGAGGTYSIEYGPSGFTPGTGTVIPNATSPENVSNLNPSTAYQFYVTKNCGASGTATAGPASFSTTAAPVVCNDPSNLNATNVTATSADLNFTPSAGAGTYNVEYGPNGFTPGTGTVVNVSTSPASVSNLNPSTAYQFYVTKNCGSGVFSNRVGPESFTTPAAPVVCNAPTNLNATNITNTSADLAFTPSAGTGTYNVEYGLAGFTPGTGTVVNVATSPASVSNLTANTSYDFYVTKNCGGGVLSNQVGPENFSTDNILPVGCDTPTNLNASNISATSASLNFSPSTTGATGTYILEYGPTGFAPGNGTVVSGLTSSPYNATNLLPGVTYDFYVQKDCGSGNLSANAGPATFTTTVLPCTTGTWTGLTSSDWHTASNWCNNTIPTSSTDVIIPALTLNQPVITANATTRDLTIEPNATLTLTSGTLTVAGLYTNNGTFNSNGAGSMVFTGAATQTVGKPGTTTIFRNLTTGGGPVNLGGPVGIRELLTLNNNLNTNGQTLTLLSAAGSQGMVVNNGGVVNGTATVQRYINPGINPTYGYRHFSSPVTSATIGQLNDPNVNLVVNPAYNTNPTPGTTRPFPTIFRYNESRLTATNPNFTFGWESPNSLSDPMPPGRGFTVNTLPTTVDISGTLNNGTVNVGPLSRGNTANSGWHMLGNPYPAPIDWDQVRPTLPAGVDDAVYVYRSTGQYSGSYSSYVNGVGGTKVIAVMQGFFVRANSPVANFAFQNSARVTDYENPAFYRQSYNETRPIIALSVEDNAGNGDQLHVYFQHGATPTFDSKYDAFKLPNAGNVAWFYSVAGNDNLSINGLPILNMPGTVVPLGAYVPQTGSYTIKADQILNFKPGQDIYLEDRTTGTLHNLRQQSSYQFTASQTDLTGRFFLRFGTSKTTGITAADLATEILVYPNPNNGVFTISMPAFNQSATQATIYNTIGQQVWQQSLKANGSQHIQETIRLDNLAAGVYTLRLETSAGPVTRKIVIE